jgi:hypothetical protein
VVQHHVVHTDGSSGQPTTASGLMDLRNPDDLLFFSQVQCYVVEIEKKCRESHIGAVVFKTLSSGFGHVYFLKYFYLYHYLMCNLIKTTSLLLLDGSVGHIFLREYSSIYQQS